MGNIRTSFVKRLAKELIETHKGVFTTDFEENKKLVQEYSTVSTKHLRNKIAGYKVRTNPRLSFFHIFLLFFYKTLFFNLLFLIINIHILIKVY